MLILDESDLTVKGKTEELLEGIAEGYGYDIGIGKDF